MKKFKNHHLIICAFIIGAILGLVLKQEITFFSIIGDVFVRLIKLSVAPLVLVAIVKSILNASETKNAKKIAFIVLLIFAITTAISSTIGTFIALIINPGNENILVNANSTITNTAPTFKEFILNLFPNNPFSALVEGNTFHVIFIAICIGTSIVSIGKDKMSTVVSLFNNANEIIMNYIKVIIKISPAGILALTATAFAKFSIGMFANLAKYFMAIIISILIIYTLYVVVLLFCAKGNIKAILRGLSKVWMVSASTSSSAATLPVSMQTCDDLGIDKKFSRFVLPLGVTMNMNGAAQFMAATFVFIAQIHGAHINLGEMIIAILMVTILVMATPGIPGGAMVPTTIILSAFNIPVEYFSIIIGLYSVIDMLDTTVNVTGDIITTIFLEKKIAKKHCLLDKI